MRSTYGTQYEEDGGRLTAIIDRAGWVWARLSWRGDRLAELRVTAARGAGEAARAAEVIIDGAIARDPLLGDAHVLRAGAAETAVSALDWLRPAEIPTAAAPGRLPPGAGAAVLDVIAVLAARARVPALRYAGPYPTPGLWRGISRSFRTSATEAEFTRDLIRRAACLARDPIPIDFTPAPCERVAIPGGHAELRDGVERISLDGVLYERDGSPARLTYEVQCDELGERRCARAEIWFGDVPYAHVATFGPDGGVLDGPRPIPRLESRVIGQQFPQPLAHGLAEIVAEVVPAPLAADARTWLIARPIRWADLGARAAVARPGELLLHAALWERIAPLGLGRLALALAEAVAPVATAAIVTAVLESRSAALRGPG